MLRIASLVPAGTRGIYSELYAEQLEHEREVWRHQPIATDQLRLEA